MAFHGFACAADALRQRLLFDCEALRTCRRVHHIEDPREAKATDSTGPLGGAVGIEIASLTSKSFIGNGVAPPLKSDWRLLEPILFPYERDRRGQPMLDASPPGGVKKADYSLASIED
jgi:hypothetical protein